MRAAGSGRRPAAGNACPRPHLSDGWAAQVVTTRARPPVRQATRCVGAVRFKVFEAMWEVAQVVGSKRAS